VASSCVGLDIGSTAIKAVILDVGRRGTRLVHFGIEYLPPQAIVDGALMDRGAVVEALERLKSALGIGNRPVATAIAGHSVIVKKIQVAAMSRDALAERIPSEAEQHIPFKRDEVDIDYQVVTPMDGKNATGPMEVILVAAKKDMIADYAQVIRDAKLQPVIMDVAAFSVQNAFEAAYADVKLPGAVALVHLGSAITHVNVVSSGVSVFVRDVTVGGAAFTEELQRRLHVSYDEAEQLKVAAVDPEAVRPPPAGFDAVMKEVADSTATKVQRSLDFFLASSPDVKLARVLLSGGSSKVAALAHEFEQRAKVPVEAMDPFRNIVIDSAKLDPAFVKKHAGEAAVSVGLALRRPGDGNRGGGEA
jgi:type IV pilus assembly protein PilM